MIELETRKHPQAACPNCNRPNVPVYELALPISQSPGFHMGALHLAAHDCPDGGDHMQLQGPVSHPACQAPRV